MPGPITERRVRPAPTGCIRDGATPYLEPRGSCSQHFPDVPVRPAAAGAHGRRPAAPLPDGLSRRRARSWRELLGARAGAPRRPRRAYGRGRVGAAAGRCCCGLELPGVVEQQAGRRFRRSPVLSGTPGPPGPVHISLVHLYIHVPFCARRCSYCDFAIAVRREVPIRPVRRGGAARMGRLAASDAGVETDSADACQTVYFGGGTPSRLEPAASPRCSTASRASGPSTPGAEITLEANPDDVTPARAAAWRAAGVNRISLGVQSFDPARARVDAPDPHGRPGAAGGGGPPARAGFEDALARSDLRPPRRARPRLGPRPRARPSRSRPSTCRSTGSRSRRDTPLGRWTARGEVTPVDEERYAAEFLAARPALARAGLRALRGVERGPSRAIAPGTTAPTGAGPRSSGSARPPTADSAGGGSGTCASGPPTSARSREGRSVVAGQEVLATRRWRWRSSTSALRTRMGCPRTASTPETRRRLDRRRAGRVATPGRIRLTAEGWLRLDALAAGLRVAAISRQDSAQRRQISAQAAMYGSFPSGRTRRRSRADLGAGPAGVRMHLRAPDHEVGARAADLGAVEQQPDVLLLQCGARPRPSKCRAAVSRQIR